MPFWIPACAGMTEKGYSGVFRSLLGGGAGRAKRQLHAGGGGGAVFPQGHLDDPVVVDPEGLADSVLGDFEPAVDVAPEFRDEVKPQVKRQGSVALAGQETAPAGVFRECAEHFLPHERLEPASGRREHPPPVHGGVVMIDAGRNREHQAQEVVGVFFLQGQFANRPYPKKAGIIGTAFPWDERPEVRSSVGFGPGAARG